MARGSSIPVTLADMRCARAALSALSCAVVLSGCAGDGAGPVAAPTIGSSAPAPPSALGPAVAVRPSAAALSLPVARVRFVSSAVPISGTLATRMRWSYRAGCPVPLADLRYVRVRHWSLTGTPVLGELVVHRDAVPVVLAAFGDLFRQHFPIRQMRLVDDYLGSDDASVAAGNTSAFNCRFIAGTTRWSEHAYGRAIDINPFENPYVRGSSVSPPAAARYADRSPLLPTMLGGRSVAVFTARGWGWGGTWRTAQDYQHVSASGR